MKLTTIFLLVLFFFSTLRAQEPPPPLLGPGEYYTNLWSVSYDYQTNGSIRYLVQDPSNPNALCAILMAQQDSNSAVGSQRYVYYSYSDNSGSNWANNVLDISANWGFPDMSLRNGSPIIAAHRFNVLTSVFEDSPFGGFSFSQLPAMPVNIIPSWPHLTGTSNGNVVVAASTNGGTVFTGYYSTYNGSVWTFWEALPLISGPSGNYTVESGTNGIVGIFGTNYDGNGALVYYKSTNNGINFDPGTEIFTFVMDGADTLFASLVGGFQAVYKGEEPHIIFSAYNGVSLDSPPNTIAFVKPKLFHWSPSSGFSTVAARSNIPNLADTITQVNVAPLSHPSISVSPSGKLYCSFTAYLRGNTQVVDDGSIVNAGEIFITSSNDNGLTWTVPSNITNTQSIEEKHSCLISHPNNDTLRTYYLRDMKAGSWVTIPSWGKAPVYGIYKPSVITGINKISSEINSFELSQNYPNPFNPSTTIKFSIPKSEFTSLIIYDELGKEVTRLINDRLSAGTYEYSFSVNEKNLSSGVYFYKLTSGKFSETKRMVLVK